MKEVCGIRLIENEKIIDMCKPTFFIYLKDYIIALIFIIAPFVLCKFSVLSADREEELAIMSIMEAVGLLWFLITFIVNKSERIVITNERIIYKKGVFNIEVIDIDIDKIQNIKITQQLFERVFGYGTFFIDTSGSSGFEATIKGVPNISKRRAIIKKVMEGK